jgi:predicted Zn finger-like uncharacterized protein
MLTVCPKCTLTLAVTATDLRTGQGYVRCGRCATVFNALVALTDDAVSDTANTQPNPVLTLPEESANDPLPPMPAPAPEPAPEYVAGTSGDDNLVASSGTGTLQTIVLEGDGATQTEEFVDIETIDSEIAAATRRQLEAAARVHEQHEEFELTDIETFDAEAASNDPEPVLVTAMHLTPPAVAPDVPQIDEPPLATPLPPMPARRPDSLLWGAMAGALLVLLATQLTHHWRNDLATSPGWYAVLNKPYRMLGLSLMPNWDLRSYDLRLLDTTADDADADAIRVSISLANHAVHAQPFPVLRLSQFDHFGKRVGTRDLQPTEYLTDSGATLHFMGVAQRVDTRFTVGKAGPDADNFELDVCLPTANGFHCANDEPLQATRS